MRAVKTLGLLGTGVIGGGWAARALHFGIDVVAADVKPEMEEWMRDAVANAEPALARLTLAPLPPKGRLSFTTDLAAMARQADFIQENIPEQLELKQRMLADVSRHGSAGRDHRLEHLRPDADGPAARHAARPSASWSRIRSTRSTCCRSWSWWAGSRRRRQTIDAARRFFTYIGMHAAARAPRGPRTPHRPAAGGDVARDPAHGQRRRRDHRRARRVDHLRPGPALGGDGHQPDLPPGRRRDRHAPHAGAVRARA